MLTFKQFVDWCNARACDGCWSMGTAMFCSNIIEEMRNVPVWHRNREWNNISKTIERDVVSVINKQIEARITYD